MTKTAELAKIKGIVFDKDGTLLDFHGTWVPRMRALLLKICQGDLALGMRLAVAVGYDAKQQRVQSNSLLAVANYRQIARVWSELLGMPAEQIEMAIKTEFSASSLGHGVPVAGLNDTLQELHARGYLLGVASMDSEAGIAATLSAFDSYSLFSFCAGYDSGHGSKPAAGMVQAFCDNLGLSPQEVLVVGDSALDIQMGINAAAGVVVGVLSGTSLAAELHGADYVLGSIADLLDLLPSSPPGAITHDA